MSRLPSRTTALAVALLLVSSSTLTAAPWVYGKLPMVATPLDSALARTWAGVKARNIQPWTDGLVHRPKSETPGDAVSEGQAYGMMLALMLNDKTAFDNIWDAAEKNLWNATKGYYDWRFQDGKITGTGMATDADQDIALTLIFADALATKGVWSQHSSPKNVTYKARAQAILNTLWTSGVYNGNLRPGASWGGGENSQYCKCDFVNPGYFSPANYRIFKTFDASHDWSQVVESSYRMIAANPGYAKGLLPDWMTTGGSFVTGTALGYNPFATGQTLYKDAIRVHWRLAMDWMWFSEPRAKTFLDAAYSFVKHDPANANFYQLDGTLLPTDSTFSLSGTKGPTRSRREHSPLTVGMWASAAMVSGGSDSADAWAKEMLRYYATGSTVWGLAKDPDGGVEDTAHNEVYFDQFLSWFGAGVLSGRFTNVMADLSDAEAGTQQAWKARPTANAPLATGIPLISATMARTGAWALQITNKNAGVATSYTGVGSKINITCCNPTAAGEPFPAGELEIKVRVRGLPDTTLVAILGTAVTPRTPIQAPSLIAHGGILQAHGLTGSVARLRSSDGRLLAQQDIVDGSISLKVPQGGIALLETESVQSSTVRRVLLLP